MLVLSRNKNGEIVIEPAGIRIVVVDIDRNNGRVKIGIQAPDDQTILRSELVGHPERVGREARLVEQRRGLQRNAPKKR